MQLCFARLESRKIPRKTATPHRQHLHHLCTSHPHKTSQWLPARVSIVGVLDEYLYTNALPLGAILSLVAVILLAGGIVMQFFIVLSGLGTSPENKVFFLQSTTDNVQGTFNGGDVPNPVRWTYLAICGTDGSNNANCGPTAAAIPFDPRRNFGDDSLIGGNSYYYLSRVSWAFYVIALFFSVVAFLVSVAAIVARLGAYLTGFFAFLAMASQAVAAALMT